MPQPADLLNENEEIVLYRHPHWSFLISGFALIVASVVVAVVAGMFLPAPLNLFGIVLVPIAILGALALYWRWRCIEFIVTTDRILVRRGVLTRHVIEIPLDRIMNVAYQQSLYERLLGTGDMTIESAGENGRQTFTDVASPSYVQNLIYQQGELYEAGRSGSVRSRHGGLGGSDNDQGFGENGGGRLSIPEQIEKLSALRDKGILSDEEFEDKKQMLLDRM